MTQSGQPMMALAMDTGLVMTVSYCAGGQSNTGAVLQGVTTAFSPTASTAAPARMASIPGTSASAPDTPTLAHCELGLVVVERQQPSRAVMSERCAWRPRLQSSIGR